MAPASIVGVGSGLGVLLVEFVRERVTERGFAAVPTPPAKLPPDVGYALGRSQGMEGKSPLLRNIIWPCSLEFFWNPLHFSPGEHCPPSPSSTTDYPCLLKCRSS